MGKNEKDLLDKTADMWREPVKGVFDIIERINMLIAFFGDKWPKIQGMIDWVKTVWPELLALKDKVIVIWTKILYFIKEVFRQLEPGIYSKVVAELKEKDKWPKDPRSFPFFEFFTNPEIINGAVTILVSVFNGIASLFGGGDKSSTPKGVARDSKGVLATLQSIESAIGLLPDLLAKSKERGDKSIDELIAFMEKNFLKDDGLKTVINEAVGDAVEVGVAAGMEDAFHRGRFESTSEWVPNENGHEDDEDE